MGLCTAAPSLAPDFLISDDDPEAADGGEHNCTQALAFTSRHDAETGPDMLWDQDLQWDLGCEARRT
jgi:hypothetical protein